MPLLEAVVEVNEILEERVAREIELAQQPVPAHAEG
jgi:hypothetical protein